MKKILLAALFVLASTSLFAQTMKVWVNGSSTDFETAKIDSITFVENTTPGTGGGGNEDTSNNVMVIDGTTYKINAVKYASERCIIFLDSATGTNVEIESGSIDESIPDPFPSSLSDVFCKLELRPGGHEVVEGPAIIKCAKNGNTYQCVISNLNLKGHTLSLSFNDDITKYPNE